MALRDLIVKGPMPLEARGAPSTKPRKDGSRDRRRKSPAPTKTYRTRKHKLEPQPIDEETWFYEERGGLLVVHEIRMDDGSYVRTDQFIIPWRHVIASVKRHELKPRD